MGACNCSCFTKNKNFEVQNEMTEGTLPNLKTETDGNEISPIDDEFFVERLDNYKKRNENFRKNRTNVDSATLNSENVSINQERNDLIFEYFKTLRTTPQKFLKEAEKYNLKDLIQSAIDNYNEKMKHLIKNTFYNLSFDLIINKVKGDKNDIMDELNEDCNFKNYNRQLFIVESISNEPGEIIWELIKENENIALKEFFLSKIDYFIISTYSVPETNQVNAYFLILKNKNV